MPLQFVKPPEVATINTMLIGPPKTGKSIAAGTAPGPILYLNADLGAATRLVHKIHGTKINEVKFQDLQTLTDANHAAKSGEFQTVVLDPFGNAFTRVLEGLTDRALNPRIDAYKNTGTYLERWVQAMCEAPVNFVLVAHDFKLDGDADSPPDYVAWTGTKAGSPSMSRKLMGMVDVVGYTGRVESQGDTPDRYVAQLVTANGRPGGDRFNVLGHARDLDLTEWFQAIHAAEPNPTSEEAKAA
jgi:hypothetical protein